MTKMTSQRRGHSRRRLLATAAGTLGGLVAAACGPLRPAAPPSDKTAEIRLSVWGDIQDWDVYAAMTSDFNVAQQRVVRGREWLPQSRREPLQTRVALR